MDDSMEADRIGHGDRPHAADAPTPPNRPDPATEESGESAQVLTFTPRQSYRQHGGRWLIEAEDALDGDTHRRAGQDG